MKPDAYMLRAKGTGFNQLVCGKVYINEEAATAAAERMTNHWRTVTVVPMYSQETIDEEAHDRHLEALFNDTLHD